MKAHIKTASLVRALKAIRGLAVSLYGKRRPYPAPLTAMAVLPSDGGIRLVYDSVMADMRASLLVPAEVVDTAPQDRCGMSFEDALRILRRAPKALTIESVPKLGPSMLKFAFDRGDILLPPVDEPYLPADFWRDRPSGCLETGVLTDILEHTRCYARDKDMNALDCVRLSPGEEGRVLAEALNGLHYANAGAEAPYLCASLPKDGILISKSAVQPLANLLGMLGGNVSMRLRWVAPKHTDPEGVVKRGVTFSGDTGCVTMFLPNYAFPDTAAFLARVHASDMLMTIDRQPLYDSLSLVESLFDCHNRTLYLDVDAEGVTLRAEATYKANLRLEAEYTGAALRIAFPATHLRAMVARHKKADTLRLAFTGPEGPCLITAPDTDMETIIMPVKIFEQPDTTQQL